MSRQIDWTKPLSDEDRAWAAQFSLHHPLIAANDEQHSDADDSLAGADLDGDGTVSEYEAMTVAQLKAECEDRDPPLATSGTKAELIARLKADDAA